MVQGRASVECFKARGTRAPVAQCPGHNHTTARPPRLFSCIIAKGLDVPWVYSKNLVLFLWNSVKNPNCHVAFLQDISLQKVDNGIRFELSIFLAFG